MPKNKVKLTTQEIRWLRILGDPKPVCELVQEITANRGPRVERQHPVTVSGKLMFAPLMLPELRLVIDTHAGTPSTRRAEHFRRGGFKVEFHNDSHPAASIWEKLRRHGYGK